MGIRILDSELVLRDSTAAAITATAANAGVNIKNAALSDYKAAINVAALDTSQDETYVITAEADTDSGFASAVTVGTLTVTAVGSYEIPLSRAFVEHLEAGATWLRLVATLGGTTPSLTYNAFLIPAV